MDVEDELIVDASKFSNKQVYIAPWSIDVGLLQVNINTWHICILLLVCDISVHLSISLLFPSFKSIFLITFNCFTADARHSYIDS